VDGFGISDVVANCAPNLPLGTASGSYTRERVSWWTVDCLCLE